MSDKKNKEANFSYQGLDRAIHERARLGILTSLATQNKPLSFSELQTQCELTNGNLSRHLQHLEGESIIEIKKQFEGKRPLTTIELTHEGRDRYFNYLQELEAVLKDAKESLNISERLAPS